MIPEEALAADLETQKAWARGWQRAGIALEQVRRDALRAITPAKALAATDDLLSLGAARPVSPARRSSSGLVELQRLLSRLRP
jgi:hypothetical protein